MKPGRPKGSKNKPKRDPTVTMSYLIATLSMIADMDPAPGFEVPSNQLVLWAKNLAAATLQNLSDVSDK